MVRQAHHERFGSPVHPEFIEGCAELVLSKVEGFKPLNGLGSNVPLVPVFPSALRRFHRPVWNTWTTWNDSVLSIVETAIAHRPESFCSRKPAVIACLSSGVREFVSSHD